MTESTKPPRSGRHRVYLGHATRLTLMALGLLCVVLGTLGILLPGLPTTPFLLLAAFLFARSSQRFHRWLLAHRWLGRYIRNFEQGRGMTRRDKAATLVTMWATMGISAAFFVPVVWGQAAMLVIAVAVSAYLLSLPTLPVGDTEG